MNLNIKYKEHIMIVINDYSALTQHSFFPPISNSTATQQHSPPQHPDLSPERVPLVVLFSSVFHKRQAVTVRDLL